MKKGLLFLAAAAMCVLPLAACGSGGQETSEAEIAQTEENTDLVDTAEDTEKDSAADDDDLKTSDTVFTEAAIEQTELYNDNGITVTATGFDANASYGPEIGIEVVNDSDMTVEVSADDVSVNGYMLEPGLLYIAASPGETVDDEITLYNYMLDASGIDTVAEISLSIVLTNSETMEGIDVGDRVTLTTTAADEFTQTVDDSGDVIYDEDGIRVVNQGLMEDDTWDGDLVLYIENGTDKYIGVTGENVTINGQLEENTNFWADLQPDTRAVTSMYLLDIEDQDINNIDDIKEISFQILIVDQDEWEQMDESDNITLSFE